MIFIKIH